MTRKENARAQYLAAKDDIAALLDLIGQEMDIHAANAAKHPTNWGPHGDAIGIRTSLKNVLQFLIGGRNRWTETEAHEFIEEHLATMREDKK